MTQKPIPRAAAIACIAIASFFLAVIGLFTLYSLGTIVYELDASLHHQPIGGNAVSYLSYFAPYITSMMWVLTYPSILLLAFGCASLQRIKDNAPASRLDKKLHLQAVLLIVVSLLIGISLFGDYLPLCDDPFLTRIMGWGGAEPGIKSVPYFFPFFVFQVIATLASCYTYYCASFLCFGGKMRFRFLLTFRIAFVYALFLAFYVFLLPFSYVKGNITINGDVAPLVIGTLNFLAAAICTHAPGFFCFRHVETSETNAEE